MPISKNVLTFLFIIFISVFGVALYNNHQIKEISNWSAGELLAAGTCTPSSHNMRGWAYAEPIGPISLNCGNGNSEYDYGVNINTDKTLSGYAWSSAIGPISFNADEICANGNCTGAFPSGASRETNYAAKVEWKGTGVAKITGWARALSACGFENGHCTTNGAGENAGGWDGWIKFDSDDTINFTDGGENYNTIIKTVGSKYQIQGNAWGGVLDNRTVIETEEQCVSNWESHCNDPECKESEVECLEGVLGDCESGVMSHDACLSYGDGKCITYLGETCETVEKEVSRPSAVLGEIRFLNSAETTYDPNNACPCETPTAEFSLTCLKINGSICYFNVGGNIILNNESSDPDEGSPCHVANDIKTSTWTPGETKEGDGNSSFMPEDEAEYTQVISLTVEDYQGHTDEKSETWTLRKAIQADFSCCIKGENDCTQDSDFKNCETAFQGMDVEEGTILYLRDNNNLVKHTIPAYGTTISSREWGYNQGKVSSETGENTGVMIRPEGVVTLKATDTSGLDNTVSRTLASLFNKIIKNPDFREIPFD